MSKKALYAAMLAVMIFLLAAGAGCKKKEEQAAYPQGGFTSPITGEHEIKLLKDVLKEDPKNLNALIKMGNAYMDSKRFKEAVDAYGKALEIDPKNIDVRVDMGTCLRYAGLPDRAVEEYRKALEINPEHLYAHKNLGIVLAYDLGDSAGGLKEFEAYLRLAPNAPDALEVKKEIENLKGITKRK
ncbi:MAG: tetratricopeptide repeat protein [Thermodesulfovibrionales bacterium]|nr:tetratricopeptide repeat protein [Thermodesulfovibrionales bacterium]